MANEKIGMMTFERLPNEIVLECLEYLSALNIFYSFNQLNNRFDQLIRTIPLYINGEFASKSIFDQFCLRMLLDPTIKRQISSINLSGDPTCYQIRSFLSFVSLDELPSLRSITLTRLEKSDASKFISILPNLPNLRYLHLIEPTNDVKWGSTFLPISNSVESLLPALFHFHSLTHLTLSNCSCFDLSHLLEYAPMLNYVNCHQLSFHSRWSYWFSNFNNHKAVYLKKMSLTGFFAPFEYIEILTKQTPNLTNLTISSIVNTDIVDADRWQSLITSSLPHLKVFKFSFEFLFYDNDVSNIIDKYDHFQNDFWLKEHRWYTEYSYEEDRAKIYTVPLGAFPFILSTQLTTGDYSNTLPKISNKFDNINILTIYHPDVPNKSKYYFPNVKELKLNFCDVEQNQNVPILTGSQYVQSLKSIVNLSHVTYLEVIHNPEIDIVYLLTNIFQEARQLSRLCINSHHISVLLESSPLYKHLKTLRRLWIASYPTCFTNVAVMKKFCRIFSGLEYLSCGVKETNHSLVLLRQLPSLSFLVIEFEIYENRIDSITLENELREMNALFRIEHNVTAWGNGIVSHRTYLRVWKGNVH
ncbi:unnamed protein product [Adineta ricciae]|uniref:F-box domain-containing protein n=1 Tax=Adineta ricciae TaxID=249248 RepID=A0A815A0V2_ADIRI|nr:unnamed protein product [Adineta ricciae]